MKQFPVSRRSFHAAALSAAIVPASVFGTDRRTAPSERIHVGIIGLGSRGFNLIDEFLAEPDARIVAVCDVDEFHHRDRPWGTGPVFGRTPARHRIEKAYANEKSGRTASEVEVCSHHEDICGRDDIDVVVVATPDHWHALCTLDALRAGKDVYCEKPVTHLFAEGQAIVREVTRQQAVFQTGSQQRSDPLFQRAVELVWNNVLGTVEKVEVGLPPGYDKPQGDTTVGKRPRSNIDYDRWCGPSPVLPYMPARHHRWWRGHRAYGGGVLMDWIGHHNDIAHWALQSDRSGPVKVDAVDWTYPETDVYNTPQHYTIACEYDTGVTSTISSRNTPGLRIHGTDGWVHVNRGKLQTSNPLWLEAGFQPGPMRIRESTSHVRNFLDCVRSRTECIAPADVGHRSITPGHLGYVSQHLGIALSWNPTTETVDNSAEANALLNAVDYRSPWQFPPARTTV